MRKGLLASVIALICVTAFLSIRVFDRADEDSFQSAPVSASAEIDTPGGDSGAAVPSPSARPTSVPSTRVGDPFTGALTDADVQWLKQHGFPSYEQAQAALGSPARVESLTPSRLLDPKAAVEAEQIAARDPTQRANALSFLEDAAEAGSIYALNTLARIYSSGTGQDLVKAAAYYRAADLRGDWVASLQIPRMGLSKEQEFLAHLYGHKYIQDMETNRLRRGQPPFRRDTRPGLNEMVQQIAARQAANRARSGDN